MESRIAALGDSTLVNVHAMARQRDKQDDVPEVESNWEIALGSAKAITERLECREKPKHAGSK